MAWRGKSHGLARLLEFLEIEHLGNGGVENGELLAPYNDLVDFGIRRNSIAAAVREGERRKLIVAYRQGRDLGTGKNLTTTYRLTYLPTRGKRLASGTYEWSAPTDDWRRYETAQKRPAKIHKPSNESDTNTVTKTILGDRQVLRNAATNRVPKTIPAPGNGNDTPFYILGRGGEAAKGAERPKNPLHKAKTSGGPISTHRSAMQT